MYMPGRPGLGSAKLLDLDQFLKIEAKCNTAAQTLHVTRVSSTCCVHGSFKPCMVLYLCAAAAQTGAELVNAFLIESMVVAALAASSGWHHAIGPSLWK
jgi:hypothetical protein